jgi:hypothetical protein
MVLATFNKDKDKDKEPVLDLEQFFMKTKKIFGILPLLLMKTRIKRLRARTAQVKFQFISQFVSVRGVAMSDTS